MSFVKKLNVKIYNEFESFELDGDYPNLIVSELENGIFFIHNVLTGENFFNSKTIEGVSGKDKSVVSRKISKYYDAFTKLQKCNLDENPLFCEIPDKLIVKLKHSDKPVTFYPFSVLTYVVYNSKETEAIITQKGIENALNEKFNNYNNIDLVDMAAKNERLKNRQKYTSLKINLLTEDFNMALKHGHKEKSKTIADTIKMYKDEFNQIDTIVKRVDKWISDEKARRPRLDDIENNEFWSGGYDNFSNPPIGFKFDKDCNYVMEASKSIVKRPWE